MHASNLVGAGADEPFTLAFWVRAAPGRRLPPVLLRGSHRAPNMGELYAEYMARPSVVDLDWFADEKASLLRFNFTSETAQKRTEARATGQRPEVTGAAWTHLALTRNKKGEFRWFVDGEGRDVAGADQGTFRFPELALGVETRGGNNFAVDFDEFCIFDRALTDDELAALAGRKALPKK